MPRNSNGGFAVLKQFTLPMLVAVVFSAGGIVYTVSAHERQFADLKSADAANVAMVMKTREGIDDSLTRMHQKINNLTDIVSQLRAQVGRLEGMMERRPR